MVVVGECDELCIGACGELEFYGVDSDLHGFGDIDDGHAWGGDVVVSGEGGQHLWGWELEEWDFAGGEDNAGYTWEFELSIVGVYGDGFYGELVLGQWGDGLSA